MRSFYLIAAMSILSGCLGYKELPVEYDYSYKANFKKYRTFDMMIPTGTADATPMDTLIEKYIVSRMKFLGYRQISHKPHLLISYKMFPDSLVFKGYSQPEIESWVLNQPEEQRYDSKQLEMKTGTLLIQFYDKRQNLSIWQGYTTAMYSSIDYGDPRTIRNAVISVLDKYRFWAEGFMDGNAWQAREINN